MSEDITLELSPEDYVLAEKAAAKAGFKSVEDWLSSFVAEKVGHTFSKSNSAGRNYFASVG